MSKINIRGIAICAIMGAIGFVFMLLEFPMPMIIPSFIKFDFSELPALITSFAFGPIYGILVCLIKNLLHLFVTQSAGVGEFSNFLLGSVFCFVSGIIYKQIKTRNGALIGCLFGSILMAIISVITNYFLVYPFYVSFFGMPMSAILDMYKLIFKPANSLIKALVYINLPFTFFKGVIDSIICFLIYKKLSPILKKNS